MVFPHEVLESRRIAPFQALSRASVSQDRARPDRVRRDATADATAGISGSQRFAVPSDAPHPAARVIT
jgi:hypothetical protein